MGRLFVYKQAYSEGLAPLLFPLSFKGEGAFYYLNTPPLRGERRPKMYYDLGPANRHASLCISQTRWMGPMLRELLFQDGLWEDLIQELYAAAFFAWKQGMDVTETRRYAGRRIHAFFKANGFTLTHHGYIKREKPFSRAFTFDTADRGLSDEYRPSKHPIHRDDDHRDNDHLDDKILAFLRKHPEGLPRRELVSRFQIPIYEINRYLVPMIEQGKVVEIERECIKGPSPSPLVVAVEPGRALPQPKRVKTERDARIRQAYFIEGKGIRQIVRELHHDRNFVRRVIREEKQPALSGV